MRDVPRQWRVAFPIVLAALIALAVVMIVALLQGVLWAAAVSGGVLTGVLLAISWALRHSVPGLSAAFLGGAAVPATLLWLMSPGSGIGGLGVAAVILAVAAAARRHATSLM